MTFYNDEVFWSAAILIAGYQFLFFLIAFLLNTDTLTDFAGGSNFIWVAILSLCLSPYRVYSSKKIIVTVLVILWALRLSVFVLVRAMRAGQDTRFDNIRHSFVKLFFFFISQMFWIYSVSLCLMLMNANSDESDFGSTTDWVGLALFIVGFVIEAEADQQKFQYRFHLVPHYQESVPEGQPPVCGNGLWKYSRHPNYFGDIVVWIGVFLMTFHAHSYTWIGILSPIIDSLLLVFASGIPVTEKTQQNRYLNSERQEEYLKYRNQTSVLYLMPPWLYSIFPLWFKRAFLFEMPFYETSLLREARRQK